MTIRYEKMSNKLHLWEETAAPSDVPEKRLSIASKAAEEKTKGDPKGIPEVHGSDADRGGWANKLDFLMSCISLSVGLGNVWRFPYLCYKNGGGSFLITYHVAMFICGIPLFFQEVAIGQYLGSGGMTFVGQLCPILKGVGFATMTLVFLLDVYYCVIVAWTLYYVYSSFSYPLPWSDCDNWWNTRNCYLKNLTIQSNSTSSVRLSPVEEFFERKVLGISQGITEFGGIQWNLFIALCIGWISIYAIIRKGLHQSGKVIWFTALFPYVILLIMLVRAVTLDGASTGLLYYVTPQWEALSTPGPWIDGFSQIFFAYSIGCGALPALGSYNKFHHNSYKDAVITCLVNTMTSILAGIVTFSILGHLALEQNIGVGDVVRSGPGLVFLTYPQVVMRMPGAPFWAATFFIMLLLLGVDSEFCLVESFITGVLDNWSQQLRPYRNTFTAIVCAIMFLLGIPMITHGGMYIFQLMDYYSASGISLLWVCFFQTIAISWIFGVEKLNDCIEQMMGIRPSKFWTLCWKYFVPASIVVIFISQCAQYQRLEYGTYQYPLWADLIGLSISFSSMIWVPGYALYYLLSQPGSILKNFRRGMQSDFKQRKVSVSASSSGQLLIQSNVVFITTPNTPFLHS